VNETHIRTSFDGERWTVACPASLRDGAVELREAVRQCLDAGAVRLHVDASCVERLGTGPLIVLLELEARCRRAGVELTLDLRPDARRLFRLCHAHARPNLPRAPRSSMGGVLRLVRS
jgi:hypothetical protein